MDIHVMSLVDSLPVESLQVLLVRVLLVQGLLVLLLLHQCCSLWLMGLLQHCLSSLL